MMTKEDFNIFWNACIKGNLNIVKSIVYEKKHISSNNYMPFEATCKNGHINIVNYLVDLGLDINNFKNHGFKLACASGHFKIVEYLISKKINDTLVIEGFKNACKQNQIHILEYLIQKDKKYCRSENSIEYMTEACTFGNLEVVKFLVKYGMFINIKNYENLNIACKENHVQIVEYLLTLEDSDKSLSNALTNVLKRGCFQDNVELVKLAIKYDFKTKNFNNALVIAAANSQLNVVNYFIFDFKIQWSQNLEEGLKSNIKEEVIEKIKKLFEIRDLQMKLEHDLSNSSNKTIKNKI